MRVWHLSGMNAFDEYAYGIRHDSPPTGLTIALTKCSNKFWDDYDYPINKLIFILGYKCFVRDVLYTFHPAGVIHFDIFPVLASSHPIYPEVKNVCTFPADVVSQPHLCA